MATIISKIEINICFILVNFYDQIAYKSIDWSVIVIVSTSVYTIGPFDDIAQPLNVYPSLINILAGKVNVVFLIDTILI